MARYRSKPREIEAVEFNLTDLIPRDLGLRANGPRGWQVWNELHQNWINIEPGVMLNITDPNDVYPIVDFDDLYEPVETK